MQLVQNQGQIRVVQSGAVILRAWAEWVTVDGGGCESFNRCYTDAANAYLHWAEHKQGEILRREYMQSSCGRMFGFRPMVCRMTSRVVWQKGRFLSVVTDSVRDSGVHGECPICHRGADVWDMERGVIIPAKYFLTHLPALRSLRVGGKKPEGLWLDEDGVVLYVNAGQNGYAEARTGLAVDFVPRRGSALQDVVPVQVGPTEK
ncbi:MAG: hypothetical protein IKZ16_08260 [Clostridia bacterium]|nr:hypothetical protein [Clostridia bacterium]